MNYHFGDKLGLYTEILKSAMMAQHAIARTGAEFADPRGALKALICAWIERNDNGGKRSWFARIMAREMAQPTPALDHMAEAMQANYLRFRTVVGKLIGRGPNDSRTRMCVHSVVGQIVHYIQSGPMLVRLWPDLDLKNDKQRRAIAEHIVTFSLAGMEGIARRKSGPRTRKAQERMNGIPVTRL